MLEPELAKINFSPNKLFNVDETGITIVQHKTSKVVGLKGKRQVASLSSAERGALITVVTCMSASGQYVPPMLVFPRKNMKAELMDGAPAGSIAACHVSGWIQCESFTKWLEHFISIVKPSREDPVVLIVDGHYSHTRNISVIDKARDNGVIIVCLPPHSTHKLQPLDVGFMGPLKTYYAQAVEAWLKSHPGRTLTHYQVASVLSTAYARAATIENAVNAFRKTGIFPFQPTIFTDDAFGSDTILQPACRSPAPTPNVTYVTPSDISPVPTGNFPSTSRRSNVSEAFLVTGTPHKERIAEQSNKKDKSLSASTPTHAARQTKKKSGGSKVRRRVLLSSSDSEDDDNCSYTSTSTDSEAASDYDTECPICNHFYSEDKKGEPWVACSKCHIWFHEECAGHAAKDPFFTCQSCLGN